MLGQLCHCLAIFAASCLSLVSEAADVSWPSREFRGVWVASVVNLDWPSSAHLSTAHQKTEMIALLDKMADLKMNAMVFQIRPVSDALYNSSIEPWSKYLTGTEGKAPSPFYDPLEFAVEECHKRNIELHAWFNPYRALKGGMLTRKYPQYAHDASETYMVMDPGAKIIQDHIYNVFLDVIQRYDIDGIHLDDYFYPYPSSATHFSDHNTYSEYQAHGGKLALGDWRRDNVNQLIQRLSLSIHRAKPWVKFGISPFGIWKPGHPAGISGLDAYDALYADSRKWIEEGWLDYITPQLYWRIDPHQQSYTALLDWWLDQNHRHHHVYPGNAAYRVFDNSHWPVHEIQRQVEETRNRHSRNSLGNVMFRLGSLKSTVYDLFKNQLYHSPALAPTMSWLHTGSHAPPMPQNVAAGPSFITWSVDTTGVVRSWAIYREHASKWILDTVDNRDIVYYTASVHGRYAIRSVDRLGNESDEVVVHVPGQPSVVG